MNGHICTFDEHKRALLVHFGNHAVKIMVDSCSVPLRSTYFDIQPTQIAFIFLLYYINFRKGYDGDFISHLLLLHAPLHPWRTFHNTEETSAFYKMLRLDSFIRYCADGVAFASCVVDEITEDLCICFAYAVEHKHRSVVKSLLHRFES